ncbi:hypothetical protein Vadar_028825 [Vaccinium darrowii]|uniref:Uncharacterized protein n=1 Tax=Vaccinium darrowii TaxID=229202 RepID=A0ACB7YZA9_9ERIC|nr:hypothetical protein Vadar_028825 [Vaccinium darrowii]
MSLVADLITVYADSLPRDMDVDWLRQIFSSFGQMEDVFIPKKRSLSFNTKFGFIRFKEKEEAMRAIDALDGLLIRNFKIFVPLAKYVKPSPYSARSFQKFQGGKHNGKLGSSDSIWKPIVREEHSKQNALDHPSYADILRGVSNGPKIKLVEAKEADTEWLKKSAVGQLINYCYMIMLQDLFISNGIWDAHIRPLGGLNIKKGHDTNCKEDVVEIDPGDDNSIDFDDHEVEDKGISGESRIELLDTEVDNYLLAEVGNCDGHSDETFIVGHCSAIKDDGQLVLSTPDKSPFTSHFSHELKRGLKCASLSHLGQGLARDLAFLGNNQSIVLF